MTLLAARALDVVARRDTGAIAALRGIDLALDAGRVLGLVGESGAGKSMIGRAIAGLLPPGFAVARGTLEFDGRDLTTLRPRERRALLGREIAFIPQEPLSALDPVRTIGSQFAEHLARLGVPRRDRRERIVAALAGVHLPRPPSLLRAYPHQLSGGMCQRVLIAMAFASHPRLVVADEPTTALDVTVQARVIALMAELRRAHATAVLFITHDLRLAATVCDDVAVLYAGAIVERGPARAVLDDPRHPYTRGLILANPSLHGPRRALHALAGQMPGLEAIGTLSGCRFAPRCPVSVAACTRDDPPLTPVGAGHDAACPRTDIPAPDAGDDAPAREPFASGAPLLAVEGVSRRFRTGLLAVDEVTFHMTAGEFVAIVGESGSGKSTLARLVVGLDRPTGGRIELDGRDVTRAGAAARRHRVATVQMVFQDPQSALNPRRRVGSIVTQAMEPRRAPAAEREARLGALLDELGLPRALAPRHPSQLSGGQKQRVNIARALCDAPRLLVADEIVSGLDVSVQAQLLTLLRRLRDERGIAVLFISHDLAVVRHLCDRVVVMSAGQIVEEGRTEAVFTRPRHPVTKALLAAAP